MNINKLLENIRKYDKISNFSEIARRVFANNSFDGILTVIGVLMGSYFSGVTDARVVLLTGFGACIAMGVSGTWATYFTEKAERRKKLLEIERSTLTSLKHTQIQKAENFAAIIVALINGISPFLSGLLIIVPFIFIPVEFAYYISIMLSFLVLGLLGVFLGKVSEENIIKSSLKMTFAGVVCILLTAVLQAI